MNGLIKTFYSTNKVKFSLNNPQLKGNPQLQLIIRNINKEIEKTQNALIMILELCQAHGVTPTLEQIRTELKKELLGEQPE